MLRIDCLQENVLNGISRALKEINKAISLFWELVRKKMLLKPFHKYCFIFFVIIFICIGVIWKSQNSVVSNKLDKLSAAEKMVSVRMGYVLETFADMEKSQKALGFFPKVSLEEGLSCFVDWYQNYHLQRKI